MLKLLIPALIVSFMMPLNTQALSAADKTLQNQKLSESILFEIQTKSFEKMFSRLSHPDFSFKKTADFKIELTANKQKNRKPVMLEFEIDGRMKINGFRTILNNMTDPQKRIEYIESVLTQTQFSWMRWLLGPEALAAAAVATPLSQIISTIADEWDSYSNQALGAVSGDTKYADGTALKALIYKDTVAIDIKCQSTTREFNDQQSDFEQKLSDVVRGKRKFIKSSTFASNAGGPPIADEGTTTFAPEVLKIYRADGSILTIMNGQIYDPDKMDVGRRTDAGPWQFTALEEKNAGFQSSVMRGPTSKSYDVFELYRARQTFDPSDTKLREMRPNTNSDYMNMAKALHMCCADVRKNSANKSCLQKLNTQIKKDPKFTEASRRYDSAQDTSGNTLGTAPKNTGSQGVD